MKKMSESDKKCKPLTLEMYLKGGPIVALRQQLMHLGKKNVLDFTGCAIDAENEFVVYRFRQLKCLLDLIETEEVMSNCPPWKTCADMLRELSEDRSENVKVFLTEGTGPDDFGICKKEYVEKLVGELHNLLVCACCV